MAETPSAVLALLICLPLVSGHELEDLDVEFLVAADFTVPPLAEQQNEEPGFAEDTTWQLVGSTDLEVIEPHLEVTTQVTTAEVTTTFSMWLHMNQGLSKQKSKEKFCMMRMAECLEDPKSGHFEQTLSDSMDDVKYTADSVTKASATPEGFSSPDPSPPTPNEDYPSEGPEPTDTSSEKIVDSKPAQLRCNSQNFMRLRECCPSSPGALFHGAIVFACAEGFSVVPRTLLREYTLNLGQDEHDAVNLTSATSFSGEMLGASVCFIECVFKKRILVTREEELDLAMVRHHFARAVGVAWAAFVLEAVSSCFEAVKAVHPATRMFKSRSRSDYCLVHPFLLLQCVRKSLLMACPILTKQQKSQECTSKLAMLRACDIFRSP